MQRLELIHKVSGASLTDAMLRRYDHTSGVLDLSSPDPSRVLFGPALTIAYLPYRKDLASRANFARMFYQAIADEQATGAVLVMSSGGIPEASMGGGTKLSRLANHKMAGVLCDGRLRDYSELREYPFATYCRGEALRWGGDRVMPYAANIPVALAGITVAPGDYIYAYQTVALCIPAAGVDDILAEAYQIEQDDARFIERIRAERAADVLAQGSNEA